MTSPSPLCSKCKMPMAPPTSVTGTLPIKSISAGIGLAEFTLIGFICENCGHFNDLKRRKSWREKSTKGKQ